MPDTLLSSLSSTLKLKTREEIARFLGESEQAVSRLGLALAPAVVTHSAGSSPLVSLSATAGAGGRSTSSARCGGPLR